MLVLLWCAAASPAMIKYAQAQQAAPTIQAAPAGSRTAPPAELPRQSPQAALDQARSEIPSVMRQTAARATTAAGTPSGSVTSSSSASNASSAAATIGGVSLSDIALDRMAPMTPEEIKRFREELERRQQAYVANVGGKGQPKPVTTVYTLDTSPGATPPVIRVAPGQGTIISFLDAAGRPWPSRVAENFSPATISVSQFTEHQLSVAARSVVPLNAGIAVALKGLPLAITLTVVSGQAEVDRQAYLMLPKYLDDAPPAVGAIRGQPSLAVGELMAYLLRTPPADARKLEVQGLSDAHAWQIDGSRMVLRTTALVASGYFRSQGLGDGMSVYEMPLSPLIRVLEGGQSKTVRLNGITAVPSPGDLVGAGRQPLSP